MAGELVTIVGLKEVQDFIAQTPKLLVAHGFAKALNAGAEVFAKELEVKTPVKKEDTGGLLDKGVLRESIMIAITLDPQFRGGRAEIGFGKNGNVADWLEYGHHIVIPGKGTYIDNQGRRRKGTGAGFVAAHPFVRPSFEIGFDAAVTAITSSFNNTIRQTLPQGPKR